MMFFVLLKIRFLKSLKFHKEIIIRFEIIKIKNIILFI